MRARTIVVAALAVLALASSARADRPADGVYGRLDGDFVLSVGGGVVVPAERRPQIDWLGELRFRYLDSAGLVVAAEGADRLIVAGDFRPLFLIRFLLNEWSGRAFLDLLLDSIGFELGAAFVDWHHPDNAGVALAVGFGLEVPILLPGVLLDGLYLRLGARHVRASITDRAAPFAGVSDWTFHAALTVRGTVDLGVASREPPRFQPDR